MRYMLDLSEKIYDPELGHGLSSTEYIFKKYYNIPRTFMSFTAIDKLGINPKSRYETPLGIYTYPIKQFFDEWVGIKNGNIPDNKATNQIGAFAPFAGENPYVWIVQFKGKESEFLDLSKYEMTTLGLDMGALKDMKVAEFEKKKNLGDVFHPDFISAFQSHLRRHEINPSNMEEMVDELDGYIDNEFEFDADKTAYVQTYAGIFWNYSRMITKNPVDWNVHLRKLGYQCIVDYEGEGIIHRSEDIQAVFLTTKGFKILDKVPNIQAGVKSNVQVKQQIKDIETTFIWGIENFLESKSTEILRLKEKLELSTPSIIEKKDREEIFSYVFPTDILMDLEILLNTVPNQFHSLIRLITKNTAKKINLKKFDVDKTIIIRLFLNLFKVISEKAGYGELADHAYEYYVTNNLVKDLRTVFGN